MFQINFWPRNLRLPVILLNSLPKAGTHLLAKVLDLMPHLRDGRLHFGYTAVESSWAGHARVERCIPAGVDCPRCMSAEEIANRIGGIKGGRYITAHMPFSREFGDILDGMGVKSLLILRDPRDVVVSHANYIARNKEHFLHGVYKDLTSDQRITTSIKGIARTADNSSYLLNIKDRCRSIMPFMREQYNHTVYFENLVGEKGGGSLDIQMEEIKGIAGFIGISCTERTVERISRNVFGGTVTFNKGIIGSWKEAFSPEHKAAFKETAGDVLIEMGYERDFDW